MVRGFAIRCPWEALTNSNAALLDLKRAAARRIPQVMAVALGKGWNNADVRFRPSPTGPAEQPALFVIPSHQAVSMLSKEGLDCELLCRPESYSN